ncbi:MAG: nuclear transport factor 2 family protein [Woeseia sp.]
MVKNIFAVLVSVVTLFACAASPPLPTAESAQQEVMEAERAFAGTMADRDHQAFASFIADDAIFFGGPDPLRGKQQVVDGWAGFFAGPDAPFSWEPAAVEVLESGALALSSGPVRDSNGNTIAQFSSIWRREPSGAWRVVFDKGCDVCDCASQ